MQLNTYIDHTLLKPSATQNDILKLCTQAKTYHFFSVCVNSCYVKLAKETLRDSEVKVCTVVGFPLGAMSTEAKVFEAIDAVKNGADEIDMVINIGWLKSKAFNKVLNDISNVKEAIGKKTLKVILEISELTNNEIIKACHLCIEANADFVKTSTGFSKGGATLEAVTLMRQTLGNKAKIKASGGIRDAQTALQFIEAGADRIGASSGVAMMTSL